MTKSSPVQPLDQSALEAATTVDADGVSAVILGTAAWAIAGLVLLIFFREPLSEADQSWWLWVCATGFGLGLVGLPYVLRRRDAYRRHAAVDDARQSHS